MTRLLFFDIDGTLIDDSFELPSSVRPALEKARELGCRIFINTGRTLCNIDRKLKESLPIDGYVLGCGTRVIAEGKTLKELEYSHEESMKIVYALREVCIPTVFECDTGIYYDDALSDGFMTPNWRGYTDSRGLTRFVDEGDPDFKAVKFFCYLKGEKMRRLLVDTLRSIGYSYYLIDRGREGYEVVPEGCSKATGIDIVREFYKADLDDCYVFGDSENDLSMLKHVRNSIAMGQSPDNVKKYCKYVTDTPENDGIAKALQMLGLLSGE